MRQVGRYEKVGGCRLNAADQRAVFEYTSGHIFTGSEDSLCERRHSFDEGLCDLFGYVECLLQSPFGEPVKPI